MQIKHKIYLIFILIVNLFSYNCSGIASENIAPDNSSQFKMDNNKVKVSVKQQKSKIIELEELVKNLNSRIEYQEGMLGALSEEFKDQMQIANKYDSSTSEITQTLIKMKNKFEILEDRAFYTDSVYFEIINDLVKIDSKLEILSIDYEESVPVDKIAISEQEYSKRYYEALNSFIHNGTLQNSLNEFKKLIVADSNHSLSDNCQYWIGEIYYKQKLFKESIVEFQEVSRFIDSNKLDDAKFKIILCYINLNDYDSAIRELNDLKIAFSNSEYIDKANVLINKNK